MALPTEKKLRILGMGIRQAESRGFAVLAVGFEDEALLDHTAEAYSEAVRRGELDQDEAVDNLAALAMGMLKITCK